MSLIGSKLHHHSCKHGSRSWCSLGQFKRQFVEFESSHHIRHSVMLLSPSPYTQVKKCLNERCLRVLVQALVISRIDYCNSILAGLPAVTIHPLTTVLYAAARILKDIPHRDHITSAMRNLHWLPIAARVTFKLSSLMYNIFSHRAPTYMSSLINARSNQTESRGLPSTSRGDAVVPKTNRNYENVLSPSLDQLPGTVCQFKFEEPTL